MKIVFATKNQNKIKEIKPLFPKKYKILSLDEIGFKGEILENGDTLEENAKIKADLISKKYSIDCFADDSGLEIEALKGDPGVFSARYAGIPKSDFKNIEKVLKLLSEKQNRKAQFRTVIALKTKYISKTFEGVLKGTISNNILGLNGFGYDPIFLPYGSSMTLGEYSNAMKNKISHRSIAVYKLIKFLKSNNKV